MNHAITVPRAAQVQRANRRRPAFGWGISLAVHMLAIAWLWQAWPRHPADVDVRLARAFAVRLVPVAADVPALAAAPSLAVPVLTHTLPRAPLASRRPPANAAVAASGAAPAPEPMAIPPGQKA